MNKIDWEMRREAKNRKLAEIKSAESSRSRDGKKCKDCGLYSCICQDSLLEWEKNLHSYKFHKDKRCKVCGLYGCICGLPRVEDLD